MPMSSSQLAALVDRARQKAPPAVSPPLPPPVARPQRPVPAGQRASGPPAPSLARRSAAPDPTPLAATDRVGTRPIQAPPPEPSPTPAPEPVAAPEDFPEGWALTKESWYFHRRFYRVFRRPMAHGEYSHLLWQIRRRKAEHLADDCWRVTLPDGRRTLAVRATRWQLLTILPKNWQPPAPVEEQAEIETSAA